MPRLSGPEYESLVQELVATILSNPGMTHYKRGFGGRNRIRGASG